MCPSLAELPFYSWGTISHIDPLCPQELSLLCRGFIPGKRVKLLGQASFGGPLRLALADGGTLAIRPQEAKSVFLRFIESGID
jgi:Fe2+ transport system protein FeoA